MPDVSNENISQISAIIANEYQRGVQDTINRITQAAHNGLSGAVSPGIKMRAPRGSAKALIDRVLTEQPGATVSEISAAAKSAVDKSVSVSAIRFELYHGRKERRYKNSGHGHWTLAVKKQKAGVQAVKSFSKKHKAA